MRIVSIIFIIDNNRFDRLVVAAPITCLSFSRKSVFWKNVRESNYWNYLQAEKNIVIDEAWSFFITNLDEVLSFVLADNGTIIAKGDYEKHTRHNITKITYFLVILEHEVVWQCTKHRQCISVQVSEVV